MIYSSGRLWSHPLFMESHPLVMCSQAPRRGNGMRVPWVGLEAIAEQSQESVRSYHNATQPVLWHVLVSSGGEGYHNQGGIVAWKLVRRAG
jgi:hypothetical protein